MTKGAVRVFGSLVRARRRSLGLSQEALAAAAFNNPARKSYVSALENGRLKNIAPATSQKLAVALDIPREDVPSDLRWQTDSYFSPTENRLNELEQRLADYAASQGSTATIAEALNEQLARQLEKSVTDTYFLRLRKGLEALKRWTGAPFSLRSLAISFTFAFIYIVFAGLLALGNGAQSIGEITLFSTPPWAVNWWAWGIALCLIGFRR